MFKNKRGVKTKICRECGVVLTDNNLSDSLRSRSIYVCKTCTNAIARRKTEENPILVKKRKVRKEQILLGRLKRGKKHTIRATDRNFFMKRLSKEMFGKYEVNHDWDAWEQTGIAWVTLLTPEEHRNDKNGKHNQTSWIEKEDWLIEIYGGEGNE